MRIILNLDSRGICSRPQWPLQGALGVLGCYLPPPGTFCDPSGALWVALVGHPDWGSYGASIGAASGDTSGRAKNGYRMASTAGTNSHKAMAS